MKRENAELMAFVRGLVARFAPRIIDTWLIEFGYVGVEPQLVVAVKERGTRIARELRMHEKRLADRAQMDGRRQMSGEASVIR